jgi:hypothetical protein
VCFFAFVCGGARERVGESYLTPLRLSEVGSLL